jgi:protein-L-isoaspartate O-methyltransferase
LRRLVDILCDIAGLVIDMHRDARIYDCAGVLDVGTRSGYGAALPTPRLGSDHVTSIDIGASVTTAVAGRLASFGAHPRVLTADITGDLPGAFNRIVPVVSLPATPAAQPGHDTP